jgi:hypothetical protein
MRPSKNPAKGGFMRSLTGCSGIVSVAMCALLSGCNAVEDVQQEPGALTPTPTAVLQGKITGLGSRRPVVLEYNGRDSCVDPTAPTGPRIPCRFFGVLGQDSASFSFGSLPVGTRYNITVRTQPFAKICTVVNGSGVLGTQATHISVVCVNDPAVPRYAVRGTIAPTISSIPGLKVMLSTEEGMREIAATGQTTFEFPAAVFDSQFNAAPGQLNLPMFGYAVTATAPAPGDGSPVNNCAVSNGTNIGVDGTVAAAPSADVTGVAVTACSFTVQVRADYSAAAGQPALAMPAGGLAVALRNPVTGLNVQSVNVPAFGSLVAFPGSVASNPQAIYELVVTEQPVGMTCLPGFGPGVPGSSATDAGAVLLLQPAAVAVAGSWLVTRSVRCRANPAVAGQLRGSWQLTTVSTASGAAVTTTLRNFLTFFEDGTFLYGLHGTGAGCSTACGVQQGFYAWNAAAGQIAFTVHTDTVTGTNANKLPATLTSVAMIAGAPAQISATLNSTTNWLLIQPPSIPGQMTGAWATSDHRRVWIYEGNRYTGFHAGVNGMGNAQDACFPIDPPSAVSGYFTRRGNATTCQLGDGAPSATQIFTLEVPNGATAPRAPPGFVGGWPQARSNADGRPSAPVLFWIAQGSPDTLTVQDTAYDGTPVNPPIVLQRVGAD